jgi:hypothetical protein
VEVTGNGEEYGRDKLPVRLISAAMDFILSLGERGDTPGIPPTPGVFLQRVRNCMKTNELSFW